MNLKSNTNLQKSILNQAVIIILSTLLLLVLASCQAENCSEVSSSAVFEASATPIIDIVPDTATPSPTVEPTITATPIQPSKIESASVEAEWLPYDLPYQVYLPAGYQEQPASCYPMLILLHGQSYNESQWLTLGVQEFADQVIFETQQPFLIFMPREAYYLQEMEESLYEQAIAELLLDEVLVKYPLCEARTQHAVGGISRGATWAVWIGFDYPTQFAIVGAHSLPPHRNDVFKLAYWVKDMPKEDPLALYIDIGAYDSYVEAAQIFENYLVKYHVQHEFHLNDGMHEDAYWQAHLLEYLRWYAAQFHEPISSD
ncbi:MAG: hypothetical protein JEZ00_21575 [Anaerolineaceae bacterium]|nr:hypothetical protein [Anaerolineaceae bacterium]